MRKSVALMTGLVVVLALVLVSLVVVLVTRDDSDDPGSAKGTPTGTPSGSTGTVAPTDTPSGGLDQFYDQTIDWSDCGSGLECGKLTVPIDYEQPDDGSVQLNLKRAPAQDQGGRVGSLVVNPGGPGAPGTTMADDADYYFGDPLLQKFDIVAFDPRGTGESDPVDCLSDADLDAYIAEDPSPDTSEEETAFGEEQQKFFQGCVDHSDDLVGHVSTIEAAKDMDVLRAALGEDQLDYLGFSYGTTLGSTYAELFPKQVGRFVLDGATDPSLDFEHDALSQAKGFETALRSYVQNCLDQSSCFLGDTMDDALGTITDLLDSIDKEPLKTGSDRQLQIGNAFYGLILPLYSKDSWSYLDQGLQQALDGDGSILLQLSDFYGSRNSSGGYDDNSLEAIGAINCLDDPSFVDPDDVPSYFDEFEQASPTFGDVFAWGLAGCYGLEVTPEYEPLTIKGAGANPIVVVGTTRDPATPYQEAVALAKQLESGVLVSRDGDGHTGYNKGNSCVDDAVEGYLIDGTVPKDGLDC